VSELPICPIFKGEAVLKMGPIGSPETSGLNHLTPCSNPEDGIIHGPCRLQLQVHPSDVVINSLSERSCVACLYQLWCRDSSVGIATVYGLDGSGFEPR
jgi:hypothetical protein